MFQPYFTDAKSIRDHSHTLQSDFDEFRDFRNLMLHGGIYLHSDESERSMMSAAYEVNDVDRLVRPRTVFSELQKTI